MRMIRVLTFMLATSASVTAALSQQPSPTPASPAEPATAAPTQPAPSPQPQPAAGWSAEDIRAVARAQFPEGIPIDVVATFPNDVAERVLLRMLDDPAEMAAWPNVVGMLGLVGRPVSGKVLMNFISRSEGAPLTNDQARAKSGAVIGLGYLVQRTGDKPALDYLIKGARPDTWSGPQLGWTSPGVPTPQIKTRLFASLSIMALGVSGDARARPVLEAIAAGTPPYADIRTLVPGAQRTASQAVANNDAVRSRGLLPLYKLESRPNLRIIQPGVSRAGTLERFNPVVASRTLPITVTPSSPSQITTPTTRPYTCIPSRGGPCGTPGD